MDRMCLEKNLSRVLKYFLINWRLCTCRSFNEKWSRYEKLVRLQLLNGMKTLEEQPLLSVQSTWEAIIGQATSMSLRMDSHRLKANIKGIYCSWQSVLIAQVTHLAVVSYYNECFSSYSLRIQERRHCPNSKVKCVKYSTSSVREAYHRPVCILWCCWTCESCLKALLQ
jgi:hypothetical protein